MNIKVIGAGGIGGWLIPPLCLFLESQGETHSVTVIDGDRFEEGNKTRQLGALDGSSNKAEYWVSLLGGRFIKVRMSSSPEFITESNSVKLIREFDFVFACVDNHKTRRDISQRCSELRDVTLISGGNDTHDGNIQVYIRRDGKDVTLPLASSYHPEIKMPRDKNPGEAGCDTRVASEPQILFTNFDVAACMLNAFHLCLDGSIDSYPYDEVYTDMRTNRREPVRRR